MERQVVGGVKFGGAEASDNVGKIPYQKPTPYYLPKTYHLLPTIP